MDSWICYFMSIFILVRHSLSSTSELNNYSDPKFSAPIANVTVPVGRDAIITCLVHELVSYKVAWLRVDTQTILTIQNHVITKNHRIGISHTEHRIWQLRIREVRESDRGWYMCQINTDPMKSQVGYLDVVVSPDIIDYQTSHDIAVQEGQNVTFVCTASGLPTPVITWRREKEVPLLIGNGKRKIFSLEGPNLTLSHVNRDHMGAYLCIASNGVPPTVSKRVLLIVNFAPKLYSLHRIIYAAIGQRVILECVSESHPLSINYWLKDKEYIQGGSYELETVDNVHKIVMRLTIRPAKVKEFGEYKCVSKNLLGETEKTTYLYRRSFYRVYNLSVSIFTEARVDSIHGAAANVKSQVTRGNKNNTSKMNSHELKRNNLEDNEFILIEDILSRNVGLNRKNHIQKNVFNIILVFLINNYSKYL